MPVVKIQDIENRAGGAGNVALNIATLGAGVDLLGITGNDDNGRVLNDLLQQAGVSCHFLQHPQLPTITKLARTQPPPATDPAGLRRNLQHHRHEQPVSGLHPGSCNRPALSFCRITAKVPWPDTQRLIAAAREAGVPVLIDPKGTDFERYRGATLLTPNLSEFEAVAGHCADDDTLIARAQQLITLTTCRPC